MIQCKVYLKSTIAYVLSCLAELYVCYGVAVACVVENYLVLISFSCWTG